MPEASSSFITFLTSYKNKPEICCRKDILSLVNGWQLTVPSLTLFFPWPGPITEVEARSQHGLMTRSWPDSSHIFSRLSIVMNNMKNR